MYDMDFMPEHQYLYLQTPFKSVWKSLIKTSVMMIGEFEYDTIFDDNDVSYEPLSYIAFCVFMVVMSIIIMNLLVCTCCRLLACRFSKK